MTCTARVGSQARRNGNCDRIGCQWVPGCGTLAAMRRLGWLGVCSCFRNCRRTDMALLRLRLTLSLQCCLRVRALLPSKQGFVGQAATVQARPARLNFGVPGRAPPAAMRSPLHCLWWPVWSSQLLPSKAWPGGTLAPWPGSGAVRLCARSPGKKGCTRPQQVKDGSQVSTPATGQRDLRLVLQEWGPGAKLDPEGPTAAGLAEVLSSLGMQSNRAKMPP